MTFDVQVPPVLKREQQWFGSIIGRPIDVDSLMNPLSPSGISMEIEAAEHILPSHTLNPAERIQIYNQQYWWRLLNNLHDLFPLVTSLFGYRDFNQKMAIPYLVKYPPRHWSLVLIGDRLQDFIQEEYKGNDKELIYQAVKLDWSFTHSFIVESFPPLTTEQLPALEISKDKLFLQPHIHLFSLSYDLFQYRVDFLKQEPDYWIDNDFPKLEKEAPYHFILNRNQNNDIAWKKVSESEYSLLHNFKNGASIDEACEWLENQQGQILDECVQNLQLWFQDWTIRGWLCLKNNF